MRIIGAVLLVLCVFTPAWAEMTLLQKVVPYEDNSLKMLPDDGVERIIKVNVQPIRNSDWVYVKLSSEQNSIIIFDQAGNMVSQVRNFDVTNCLYLSLSPDRSILALDSGLSHNRSWTFMTLPDYQPIGQAVQYSQTLDENRQDLIWLNDMFVLVPVLNEPKERELKCGDRQVCGNHSINLYNLRDQILMPLFRGTDLCDYYYTNFEHPVIFGEKVCVENVADWNNTDKQTSSTRVIGALPEHYRPDGRGGL